jgi:guanine deaminase
MQEMNTPDLSATDRRFLREAIDVSRRAIEDESNTPFGAVVVVDGEIVGEGTSSVMGLCDPTAHAEVMALRSAGARLGRHLMPDAAMYASSEPCPMCLVACYWAQIPRLVFGATSRDVAAMGFEDLQFYRELTLAREQRSLQEIVADSDMQNEARAVLKSWTDRLPAPVKPKY